MMVAKLITTRGLADRFGKSEQWVRVLMGRKGAPDPIEVEGLTKTSIYATESAVAWVDSQLTQTRSDG